MAKISLQLMGTCVQKRGRIITAPPTSACGWKTINELRETVVFHIIRLHQIVINCHSGIEECLIQNLKDPAVIIKGKEKCVRKRMEDLQGLVKIVDDLLELEQLDKNKQTGILKAGSLVIKELASAMYIDDIADILKNDKEYNASAKAKIFNPAFSEKSIFLEIETEFQKYQCSVKRAAVRRRYLRNPLF